jgi:hypothetical protein
VPFKVTLGTADLGVFKVFRNKELAENEIDMLRIMASKHPTAYHPVEGKSDGVTDVSGTPSRRGAMLMETAQGDSVTQLVKMLPRHGDPRRGAGIEGILRAAERVAHALADLHKGTASGKNLTREQKVGKGSDAHYLRYTKLPACKAKLAAAYEPICRAIDDVMAELADDRVVVPATGYHGDANLGNFVIDRGRVNVFDVDGMQWSIDKATEQGTKTGASDLGRFIGSLGTMHVGKANSLNASEQRQIRDAFLFAYFQASAAVSREHLEPAITLARVELELAALNAGSVEPRVAIGRISDALGGTTKQPAKF